MKQQTSTANDFDWVMAKLPRTDKEGNDITTDKIGKGGRHRSNGTYSGAVYDIEVIENERETNNMSINKQLDSGDGENLIAGALVAVFVPFVTEILKEAAIPFIKKIAMEKVYPMVAEKMDELKEKHQAKKSAKEAEQTKEVKSTLQTDSTIIDFEKYKQYA